MLLLLNFDFCVVLQLYASVLLLKYNFGGGGLNFIFLWVQQISMPQIIVRCRKYCFEIYYINPLQNGNSKISGDPPAKNKVFIYNLEKYHCKRLKFQSNDAERYFSLSQFIFRSMS